LQSTKSRNFHFSLLLHRIPCPDSAHRPSPLPTQTEARPPSESQGPSDAALQQLEEAAQRIAPFVAKLRAQVAALRTAVETLEHE
jgi:hypothetical protein